MILCFSGTGNSAYVAKRIGEVLDEPVISINDFMKTGRTVSANEGERLVFVTPTYAWRIPRVVEEWIRKCGFAGKHNTYFVMTCGDDNGIAGCYAGKFCAELGLTCLGCAEVVMPENYIAMYTAPAPEEAKRIIADAEQVIAKTSELIREDKELPEPGKGFVDIVKSCIVNPVFYRFFVRADKFYVKDTCKSCGKCVENCPLNNIELKNGRPAWGNKCTHCMACICRCPAGAIEYGKHSIGKKRYVCPF